MENKIFQKSISIDRVFYGFDPKNGSHFYFRYKTFPGLTHKEREREREKRSPHSLLSHTILSILSHTHSSPIAHPSTGESSDRTSKHRLTHQQDRATNPSTHLVSEPLLDWPTTFRSTHVVHQRVAPTNRSLFVPLSRLVLWFWFFLFWFLFLVLFIYFDSL